MIIIGLGHKARHGKNTCARAIAEHCAKQGIYAKDYAFADPIKMYCRIAFGMREKNPKLLQLVGGDLFRDHVNKDIWLHVLMDTIQEQRPEVAIITDVRYQNEFNAVKQMGGYLFRVTRTNLDGSPWVADCRDPNHSSEIDLDEQIWDKEIVAREGAMFALRNQAIEAFRWAYTENLKTHEPPPMHTLD